MRKPDVGIVAGTALLGVAVGCAALIVVNRRRVAKEKRGWLEQIPASTFSSEYARVFKLQDVDRSPYANLGGADALQCVDTRVDILVGTLVDVPGIVLYSIEVVEGKILFLFMQVPSVPKLFETPFLDRGVRALVEIGSIVVVASMDAVEKIPRLTPLDELSAKDQSRYSIVWNTGRCGSTLMHKMLQKIGVLSFSEPYWLDKILELPSQGLDHDEVGRVFCVSAALDVLLVRKWLPAHRPIFGAAATLGSGYVSFNPKGKGVLAMEPIIRSSPNAKHMLMYRDVRKVAESFGSIFNRNPGFLDRVVAFLMIWKPRSKSLGDGLRAPPNKRKPTFSKAVAEAEDSGCLKEPAKRMVKIPTVHWLETMCLWKELTENGHLKNASAASLRMEDFVRKDPELIEKILRFFLGERLEVGEDTVWLALEAFNKHSQAGDLMAKSSHSGAGVKKFLTPEDTRQIEEYVDVASWWRKNAGNILEESRGADDRDKQMLEKVVDASIPEAMVAAASESEQRIRGWRHGLIPFAKDATGNFLVADTNARGCPVEEWDAEGEVSTVSKTFSLFLEGYRNNLLSGRCEYVDGIGIIEKIDNASTRRGK